MTRPALIVIFLGGVAIAGPTDKATLAFGKPTVTGMFDAEQLATATKGGTDQLLGCYKQRLAMASDPNGTVTAKFTIGPAGSVTSATATGIDRELDKCIAATIGTLAFAAPPDGKPVTVVYPLVFESGYATLTGTGAIDDTDIYGGLLGTGWGTIGTGRYRAIGHGSGSASGYGVGHGGTRGRTSLGQPSTSGPGALDKAIIRRYIKRNLDKITACYERATVKQPALKGTTIAEFTIATSGLVIASTAAGLDKTVDACVAATIKNIEFPKPKSDGEAHVKYPFMFRPAPVSPMGGDGAPP